MPVDMVAAGITMVSVLAERRLNRLLHPALSAQLPPFLTEGAGMFSGLMLSQYTADSLVVEQRILSTPSCIQSIPAAADQEDFVSMGMNGALKAQQILKNAHAVLGIELMAGAQAIDFREWSPGRGTRAAHDAVREIVDYLDEDRPLYPDHNAMAEAVRECRVLDAVTAQIGALGDSW
jgi:histidine ammonia-lyase